MESIEIETIRRKTIIIIHAIEVGLINFIKKNSNSVVDSFYFGDLFQELTKLNINQNSINLTKELKNYSDLIELPTIRNACAHPVKDFYYYFWYRASSFASDPRLQELGIIEPSDALACVESGQLSDPPEEWLDKLKVQEITNNLPTEEEFDKTGLIGRTKEIDSVIKDILHGRYNNISIVGPGGVGKTSLAVEIGRRLVNKSFVKDKLSGLLYLTLKVQTLTGKGLVYLNSSYAKTGSLEEYFLASISELYGLSDLKLEDIKELFSNEKILVILDNLEDLIVENLESFEKLVEQLPSHWKILITSRITIDGAKNNPITGLSTQALDDLSRKYYSQLFGRSIDQTTLKQIVNLCNGNPLALKLIIDRLSFGKDIPEAHALTKEEVLNYSFKSLIEALNYNQKTILEIIFVLGKGSKTRIKQFADFSNDVLSESLSKLFKTALLDKVEEENIDSYSISSPVRDLLVRSPLDLSVRNDIERKLKIFGISESKDDSIDLINDQISRFGFEKNSPKQLIKFSRNLMKIHQKKAKQRVFHLGESDAESISKFDSEIDRYENEWGAYSDFYRMKSIARQLLIDTNSALLFAKKGFEINPESILMRFHYAGILIDKNENIKAIEILKESIKFFLNNFKNFEKITSSYSHYFIRENFSSFFKAHIFSEKYEVVIEMTCGWISAPEILKGIFVLSRCSALRRSVESVKDDSRNQILNQCFPLLKYLVIEEQFVASPVKREAEKLRGEYSLQIDRKLVSKDIEVEFLDHCKFLTSFIGDESTLISPISTNVDNFEITENIGSDLIVVAVTYSRAGFCLAEDDNKNVYFVPFARFKHKGIVRLSVGEKIKIWNIDPEINPRGNYNVSNAMLLD